MLDVSQFLPFPPVPGQWSVVSSLWSPEYLCFLLSQFLLFPCRLLHSLAECGLNPGPSFKVQGSRFRVQGSDRWMLDVGCCLPAPFQLSAFQHFSFPAWPPHDTHSTSSNLRSNPFHVSRFIKCQRTASQSRHLQACRRRELLLPLVKGQKITEPQLLRAGYVQHVQ
jgi:hypothetical protein